VAILGPGDFFGEACLAGQSTCMTTATAIGITAVLIIDKHEMIRALHEEHEFCDRFIAYMLTRNIRVEEDLLDQLSTPARNAGADFAAAGALRFSRQTSNPAPKNIAGDVGRNGRHNPLTCERRYE
jgi:CRP-like cAMP-binding protein